MYYLCEKYCKPVTVKYYIANFVGLMNKLDLQTCSEQNSFIGRELTEGSQGRLCKTQQEKVRRISKKKRNRQRSVGGFCLPSASGNFAESPEEWYNY